MINTLESKVVLSSPVTSSNGKSPTALKAHQIFFNNLPASWYPREQCNSDVSYDIEVSIEGIGNIIFSVYIKAISCINLDNEHITCTMDTDKLRHFYEDCYKPTFLVLVDTSGSNSCYWLPIQEYVHNKLEKSLPNWRNKKTASLRVPSDNNLSFTYRVFEENIVQCLSLVYLNHFYFPFKTVTTRLRSFLKSPIEIDRAIYIASTRPYGSHLNPTGQSCSSGSCQSCNDDSGLDNENDADRVLQSSLEYAQGLKLLDPTENRKAYYHLFSAMELSGEKASMGMRYTVQGEMSFYDYLLYFMDAFSLMGNNAMFHLTKPEEMQRYFTSMDQLAQYIVDSLNDGEIIATSMTTIRLADTYLFATPYISRTFGQEKASPLMDFAQSLLILAHELATVIESPGTLIQ